ncbi:MAG TPA: DNA polymerase III subunit chi [Steroidobacteraceae bacterium]|nr:DNA polymerase III subunit chi [Steroidobacteraceae bacterium]
MAAVTFYLGDAAGREARLQLACRVTERAWRAGHRVLVLHGSAEEQRALDEYLWTFADGSFVPHEALAPGAEAPILLSCALPPGELDVLVNLTDAVPDCLQRVQRIAEIIDADPAARSAGRSRFRAYREAGIEPATHEIRA